MTKISLIIPCYNESANLPLLINRCKELFNKESTIEIVIVDNGSEDDTALILDKLTKKLNYIIDKLPRQEVAQTLKISWMELYSKKKFCNTRSI